MKKAVFKLEAKEDKVETKALKRIVGLAGVDSVSIDEEMKLTVIGDIDPRSILSMLRKLCHTDIVSVGPAKEPEKKDDKGKKEKKDDKGKKEDDEKKKLEEIQIAYKTYDPYVLFNAEENFNANACVIF